ncbi:T9SS type A sorting domain-containing protein [candidate division KSB1 bacterium]|nr:T9SS type A sorting domain-containing protein [candidate division KSB1 bacterium]
MKKLFIMTVFLFSFTSIIYAQVKFINFFSGGLIKESYYLWTWGFFQEPQAIDGIGYVPGTAAIEADFQKTDDWTADWTSYGVYIGDEYFNIDDIEPDSVYFKLKAPDGVGEADRFVIWLYDDNNSTWDNALFYEMQDYLVLADAQWHQFSVALSDFEESTNPINYTAIKAISLERPAEDEDSEAPILYIDHVWIGLPDEFAAVAGAETETVPSQIDLAQNYPNPFNPVTYIAYSLEETQHVNLAVYNVLGKKVAVLENGIRNAGAHRVRFDATGLSSNIYFYRLEAGDRVLTQKMIMVK